MKRPLNLPSPRFTWCDNVHYEWQLAHDGCGHSALKPITLNPSSPSADTPLNWLSFETLHTLLDRPRLKVRRPRPSLLAGDRSFFVPAQIAAFAEVTQQTVRNWITKRSPQRYSRYRIPYQVAKEMIEERGLSFAEFLKFVDGA